jgi:hypothetical protein
MTWWKLSSFSIFIKVKKEDNTEITGGFPTERMNVRFIQTGFFYV